MSVRFFNWCMHRGRYRGVKSMAGRPKLVITASYFPPRVGGLERYAHRMAVGARDGGYEVTVVTTSDSTNAGIRIWDGIKIYELPVKFKVSFTPLNPAWILQIRRIIDTEQPDIINVHTPVPGLGDLIACGAVHARVGVTYRC